MITPVASATGSAAPGPEMMELREKVVALEARLNALEQMLSDLKGKDSTSTTNRGDALFLIAALAYNAVCLGLA